MNKGMVQGIVIGAVVVTAGAALAHYKPWSASDPAEMPPVQAMQAAQPIQADTSRPGAEALAPTQSGPATAAAPAPVPVAAAAAMPLYAVVTNVEPVTKSSQVPRQVCHDEQVTEVQQPKDQHRVAGSVIGALVGGVVGNQVGHGAGRTLATIAGAAGGGYAGNRIQNRVQQGNTVSATQQRCETVYDTTSKQSGYRVTYRLNGETKTLRMDHDPGDRIPIENGKLVLASR